MDEGLKSTSLSTLHRRALLWRYRIVNPTRMGVPTNSIAHSSTFTSSNSRSLKSKEKVRNLKAIALQPLGSSNALLISNIGKDISISLSSEYSFLFLPFYLPAAQLGPEYIHYHLFPYYKYTSIITVYQSFI